MAMRRAFSTFSLAVLTALLAVAVLTPAASAGGGAGVGDVPLGWISSFTGCRGTIAECLGGAEFELNSESSRRILATSNYISYNALSRDRVPCSRRGASYYNCRPGAQANPYSRSCSAITRCRS